MVLGIEFLGSFEEVGVHKSFEELHNWHGNILLAQLLLTRQGTWELKIS